MEAENENRLSITPPIPAIPAPMAKTRIRLRLARMPDAIAAVGELRTARVARPVAEWVNSQMIPVMSPKTAMNSRI